jgi:Protein of unknown function (DUF3176)
MAVYDNVFRPLGWTNSYFQRRAQSHHDEVELRGEEYRRNDQGAQQLIPRNVGSEEERITNQPSQFSISRKPIGYSQSSMNPSDRKDPYEQISPGYPHRQPQGGGHYGSLRIWWTELLCCVLFIGAFVAIVLTIRPYEGRPLPQWPYQLSINSLISIYIVILKASMLLVAAEGLSQLKWRWFDHGRPLKDLLSYDNASRGPWGSLTLMWTLRGRQLVSSCGAFITVAALIIDPFAQQVIATYACRIPAESIIATIPRTSNYHESGPHTGAGMSTITLGMQNSINAGIFNPGRSVAFDCPTGNCTFPSYYHTVGFCSDCIDATNELHVSSEVSANNLTAWNLTLPASSASPSQNTTAIVNGMATSGGSDYLLMKSSGGRTDIVVGFMTSNMSESCEDTCPSLEDENYDKCNANWQDVQWGCAAYPGSRSSGIGAARCSLFPCVRTYNAIVAGGRWLESLLSVATEWNLATNAGGIYSSMLDIECLNAQDKQSLTDAGYNFEGRSWIPYNLSVDYTGNFSSGTNLNTNVTEGAVSGKCIYQHGAIAINSIDSFLATFLNGTIKPGTYWYDYHGSAQLQAIYNEGNLTFDRINETWRNISDSITTYMRQNGDVNFSTPATGQALRDQTCVHIRWAFLAYPAVLVLLAIIFFICMVFETRRGQTSRHDWKSSPLALLFHGLDREALKGEETFDFVSTKEMDQIAGRTPVRLSQTEHGWQFVGMQHGLVRQR